MAKMITFKELFMFINDDRLKTMNLLDLGYYPIHADTYALRIIDSKSIEIMGEINIYPMGTKLCQMSFNEVDGMVTCTPIDENSILDYTRSVRINMRADINVLLIDHSQEYSIHMITAIDKMVKDFLRILDDNDWKPFHQVEIRRSDPDHIQEEINKVLDSIVNDLSIREMVIDDVKLLYSNTGCMCFGMVRYHGIKHYGTKCSA